MFERVLITVAILVGLSLLWLAWNAYKSRLIRSIEAGEQNDKPTLLYFTGEYCTVCKFQQSPVVEKIMNKFGNTIAVKQVDVSDTPDLARQYKVLTLPTTVILSPEGQVKHINYGVTPQTKLEMQLF